MKVQKGHEIELSISGMAFGGKGIARIDGFTIFVDQAVPFDRVLVRIVKKKQNYAEASIRELLDPSPFRIDAPCKYSGYCGGCKWQFIHYEQQLLYKRQHVVDSLERIGFLKDVPVHSVIPSRRIFEYRNKMEFSCSDKRWLLPEEIGRKDIEENFALGLHVPGTFHKVLDVEACLLQPALGNRILEDVRAYIKTSPEPVYGLRSHIGFWRFIVLRHSVSYDQWMVNVVTSAENREAILPLANRLMDNYPQIVSVVNNITSRQAGIAVGEVEITLGGSNVIKDKIGFHEFEISGNSFFQTNTRSAEVLYDVVKDFAELTGHETVLDLYSGTGTIAIHLSDSAGDITGIELVESAVRDSERNRQVNNVSNCRFIQDDIRKWDDNLTNRPDVLIIDPPRSGMHKEVVTKILKMAAKRIVYVSCNPATLARDLGLMKDFYRVLEIQPVDMFPHTAHIEVVAKLAKH